MQRPNPQYARPNLDPETADSPRMLRVSCSSGNLEEFTSLVQLTPCSPEYLTQGLFAAARGQNIEVVEYLLEQGTQIDSAVELAAVSVKSLPIFRLLEKYGWNVQSEGETLLL